MDINKKYRNPNLESRRQHLIECERADLALRQAKLRKANPRSLAVGAADELEQSMERVDSALASKLKSLVETVSNSSALISPENKQRYLPAIRRLLMHRALWIRDPRDWRPRTHNVRRQFSSLARHLLCRFAVPAFFDEVWFDEIAARRRRQGWFIHVGQGANLRKAAGLPIAMTKLMAHRTMNDAPAGVTLSQAIRFGQCRALGLDERLTRAILGSRIGDAFFSATLEAFWSTVLSFFARHPMIDATQVGPIIDYLHNQRFVPAPPVMEGGVFVAQGPPQPGLSMKDREPEALVRQVQSWHRGLTRRGSGRDFQWTPCGIDGYDRIEGGVGNQRRFTVAELTRSDELRAEGTAMKHCVSTYGWSCREGRSAIYSMQVTDRSGSRRLLTVEVNVRTRQIVQARGKFNASATQLDRRILSGWAGSVGLSFGKYAVG